MKVGKSNRDSIADNPFLSPLLMIHTPPEYLLWSGKLPVEKVPTVAIIGTRRPTAYGREVTRQLATELAQQGVVIVSGLALGIDAIAHQAALEAGGVTIAVLPTGLPEIYPATHRQLAQRITKQGGALISEYPPGTLARKHHFLARNRLISGLADALIVTEAADRSGTLSTVGHALEQNKDVFAVPGPITSLLSVGPNRLLQQGAHIAMSAQDILHIVAPERVVEQVAIPLAQTPVEQVIIDLIRSGVNDGDELLYMSKIEASEFLQTMTMLELRNVVKAMGGNRWRV